MRITKSGIMITVIVGIVLLFGFRILFPSYDGPISISDPIQIEMTSEIISHRSLDGSSVEIELLAEYEGNFAVQGVEKYKTDGAALVSSRDFILSWGDLPKKSIDDEINYSQRNRWYYYAYSGDCPVDGSYISTHSANTHMIGANESVQAMIEKVKENQYIYLKGYLVEVHFEHGNWTSSLTRQDTGDGSCEIFYVTEISGR